MPRVRSSSFLGSSRGTRVLAPESSTNTHAGWYATPKCAHSEPSSVTAWGNPSPYSSTNARMFAASSLPGTPMKAISSS